MDLIASTALASHSWFAGLGPEPLSDDFSPDRLAAALAGRRQNLKVSLLDQRIVAGLGNIYVCEALYRAGLHPERPAGALKPKETKRLVEVVKTVLEEAIAAGGSTLRDYRNADGDLGYFQHAFGAYGREGEPCLTPRCRGVLARIVQSGRSTFFCPVCQK
jgi:formamidopyrimidine-DNA glycosylase